jgi:hypothetical protein
MTKKRTITGITLKTPNSVNANTDEICRVPVIESAGENTVLIIGDICAPDIKWRAGQSDPKDIYISNGSGMEQLLDFSTHNKGNILDLVLTNCTGKILLFKETV